MGFILFGLFFTLCAIGKILRDKLFLKLRKEFNMETVSYVKFSDFLKEEWDKGNKEARLACLYNYLNIWSAILAFMCLFFLKG